MEWAFKQVFNYGEPLETKPSPHLILSISDSWGLIILFGISKLKPLYKHQGHHSLLPDKKRQQKNVPVSAHNEGPKKKQMHKWFIIINRNCQDEMKGEKNYNLFPLC